MCGFSLRVTDLKNLTHVLINRSPLQLTSGLLTCRVTKSSAAVRQSDVVLGRDVEGERQGAAKWPRTGVCRSVCRCAGPADYIISLDLTCSKLLRYEDTFPSTQHLFFCCSHSERDLSKSCILEIISEIGIRKFFYLQVY